MKNIKYNIKDGFDLVLLLNKLGLGVDPYGGKQAYTAHTISYDKTNNQLKHLHNKVSTILKQSEFNQIIDNALKHYHFEIFR